MIIGKFGGTPSIKKGNRVYCRSAALVQSEHGFLEEKAVLISILL
jgi:hypothetical protein